MADTAAPPSPQAGQPATPPAGGAAGWDEMVTGTGRLRTHWHRFLAAHGPFTAEVMAARWETARRLLFQNGVSYNSYADPQGLERPWPLDPLPLLIPAEEWRDLAQGLVQRARLLEALLADVYGPQRLVRDGVVPPALLHADPGFLRPCHGVPVPARLVLLAIDLVRDQEGRWRVLACRTQAPTGLGYALENRQVLSQTAVEAFRTCGVERLAPFLEQLKATLARIAPRQSGADGAPRAVLLTPGPYHEAHFEHAYLARTLGLTLAEGEDLTVREQTVCLKTLGGLQRVDVILRRVDDDFCDPLELRLESRLGVPGLVQAVRAGTVTVANALGSGLGDSPALLPWMPALARHLLGEDLLLPDVPTRWGGEPAQNAALLDGIGGMVVRPAFAALAGRAQFGGDLDAAGRAALAERVRRWPEAWAGQEPVAPSTTPVWRDGQIRPEPVLLRAFLCATETGWQAMPGGLARVSDDTRFAGTSLQQGSGSKDVWIVGAAPAPTRRRGGAEVGRDPVPVPGDLPSRAADHLYWVGRYAERADNAVRLLRAAANRLTDDTRPGADEELTVLLRLLGWAGLAPVPLAEMPRDDVYRGMRQAFDAALDWGNPGGLRATVDRLRRAVAAVRDRLPPEVGRLMGLLDVQSVATHGGEPAALQLRLDTMATALSALTGLELDGMSRGPGWRFLVLGRRIERGIAITASLHGTGLIAGAEDEAAVLAVLLELAEAGATYRELCPVGLRREPALAVLLGEVEHPRSLAFQLDTIGRMLDRLPDVPGDATAVSPTALARSLVETAGALVQDPAPTRDAAALAALAERLGELLPEVSTLLSQAYFAHAFARPT